MEETKIEITSSENLLDPPLDEQIIQGAIFVEGAPYALRISNITVSGKYNREYKVVAFGIGLNDGRVMIDGDLLIVCLWSDLLIIDLKTDKLLRDIEFDSWELFAIYKFKSGYFIHGEGENYFLNKKFEIMWEKGCIDIFVNYKVDKILEFFDDYITVFD